MICKFDFWGNLQHVVALELAKGISSAGKLGNVSECVWHSLSFIDICDDSILHILAPLVIIATPAAGLCLYLSPVVALGYKMASAAAASLKSM